MIVKILLLLKVFSLLAISVPAKAVPYNEKRAFCLERVSFHSGQYEATKKFNKCMNNADSLIKNYEKEKTRRAQEYQRNSVIQKARQQEKQRQEQIQDLKRQKKIQQQVDNMEDLFR